VRVELGDAYAGRSRRLVFSLDVAGLPDLGPRRIADLVVHSTVVGDAVAQHRLEIPVVVHVATAQEAAAAGIDMDVREEVEILAAAKARQEAIQDADRGDFGAAQLKLRAAAARLDTFAAGSGKTDKLRAQVEDLRSSVADAAPGAWDEVARKTLRYKQHQMQRGKPWQRPRP